jgi:tRNA-splicing ligase RtcB
MNTKQLSKMGIPSDCLNTAIKCIQKAAELKTPGNVIKSIITDIVAAPEKFVDGVVYDYDAALISCFNGLAAAIFAEKNFKRPEPISYKTWGTDIDEGSHSQMKQACNMPNAVAAAMMPDAHLGYGLPIGGVLALDNAVCPFAVGVDIACRMKLSLIDMPVATLDSKFNLYKEALERGTRFGIGDKGRSVFPQPKNHSVMDEDWDITKVTKSQKDKAHKQLGTSGSGNHFVEYGIFTVDEDCARELGLSAGQYVSILSHSGSRGPGSAVCNAYSTIAQTMLPNRYNDLGRLAWLDLDTEEGQEYWAAMELMGKFAAANHEVIHKSVSKLLGADLIWTVENHHNFAWKEVHGGKEVIVHRKGATPAGEGVLGVIPGSMGTPAFVVKGKGNPESLNSASHGAGRAMSRNAAKDKYTWKAVKNDLEKKGIIVLDAAADEVPGVYKDIFTVMEQQKDLVQIMGRFDPKIVLMCGDGSKSED